MRNSRKYTTRSNAAGIGGKRPERQEPLAARKSLIRFVDNGFTVVTKQGQVARESELGTK